jgi:hypothetical protein
VRLNPVRWLGQRWHQIKATEYQDMTVTYKIHFVVPSDYDSTRLFQGLPSPIHRKRMAEIYNYSIEADGFRFIDRQVDEDTAALTLRRFIDEGIRIAGEVQVTVI